MSKKKKKKTKNLSFAWRRNQVPSTQKNFRNNWRFYGLYQAQTLNPLISLYAPVKKNKPIQHPIQILVLLRLSLME